MQEYKKTKRKRAVEMSGVNLLSEDLRDSANCHPKANGFSCLFAYNLKL